VVSSFGAIFYKYLYLLPITINIYMLQVVLVLKVLVDIYSLCENLLSNDDKQQYPLSID
jgi:hypothetical protein